MYRLSIEWIRCVTRAEAGHREKRRGRDKLGNDDGRVDMTKIV